MNYAPPGITPDTTIATFITDEQSARRIAASFTDAFAAGAVATSLVDLGRGEWRVTFYFDGEIGEAAARKLAISAVGAETGRALRFERIAARDWVAESLRELKPIAAGRFVVHGGHDRGCVPANRIGIEIGAALAFGTGHHGTTRGCLIALDSICKSLNNEALKRASPSPWKGEGRGGGHPIRGLQATPTRLAFARRPPPFRGRNSLPRILDLGTGTGVLAIAAARSLRQHVLASDIDAQAVRIARDNARLNRCPGLVRVCRANGLAAPDIRVRAPFDLVFANILLGLLQKLAAPLRKIVAPRGRVVLSGLLKSQANAALAAYRKFTLERRIELDGWTTLVLKRRSTLPWRGRVAASERRERRGGVG
jgi:ribosomal protein L11 methyltransferase